MIDLYHVSKKYGDTAAVDDTSLSVREKEIICLLGRNGAGKTTLLNLIAGKTAATSGEIAVNGAKVSTLNMPENVRYIEAAKPQFNMRVGELFEFASRLNGTFDTAFARRMALTLNLDLSKKYNRLSFGMKTMVTTIISLSSNDDVILLDEPVLGFDAVSRAEFYDLLRASFEYKPRIIIISTHLIDEIADIATRIITIDKGKILFDKNINEIFEKSYKITGIAEEVSLFSAGLNVINKEEIGKYTVAYVFDKRIQPRGNVEITDMSLQELFIKLVGVKNEK